MTEERKKSLIREVLWCINIGWSSLEYMMKHGTSSLYGVQDFTAEEIKSCEKEILAKLERKRQIGYSGKISEMFGEFDEESNNLQN